MSVHLDRVRSDFQLVIKSVTASDYGHYECQINTIPVKTRVVRLERPVVAPGHERRPVLTHGQSSSGHGHSQHSVSTPAPDSPPEVGGSITAIIGAPDIYFTPGDLGMLTGVILTCPEKCFSEYHLCREQPEGARAHILVS